MSSSLSSHDALAVSSPASGTALGAEASAAGEEPKVHAKPPTFMDVLRYKVSRAPYVGELATKVRACVGVGGWGVQAVCAPALERVECTQ